MCREAPSLSLCSEPWRLRLLAPSAPSALLSPWHWPSCVPQVQRSVDGAGQESPPSEKPAPRTRAPRVRGHHGCVVSGFQLCSQSVHCGRPSEPLGCAEPYGVANREFVCQPAIGGGRPAEHRPESRPHHPCPALPLSAGLLGSSHQEASCRAVHPQKRQVCHSRGESRLFKRHLAADAGHKKCTLSTPCPEAHFAGRHAWVPSPVLPVPSPLGLRCLCRPHVERGGHLPRCQPLFHASVSCTRAALLALAGQ